ncbi:unnamed protein product, partial [Ostreobium quekettii]
MILVYYGWWQWTRFISSADLTVLTSPRKQCLDDGVVNNSTVLLPSYVSLPMYFAMTHIVRCTGDACCSAVDTNCTILCCIMLHCCAPAPNDATVWLHFVEAYCALQVRCTAVHAIQVSTVEYWHCILREMAEAGQGGTEENPPRQEGKAQ